MSWKHPKWEETNGVRIMRICGDAGAGHGDDDTLEHWPRIAILDLSAKQYDEFCEGALQFTLDYDLFPDQPIQWMCDCVKAPVGKGIPQAGPDARWTVLIWHGRPSVAFCGAGPQAFEPGFEGEYDA